MRHWKSLVFLLIAGGCGGSTFTSSDTTTDASAGGAGQAGTVGGSDGVGGVNGGSGGSAIGSGGNGGGSAVGGNGGSAIGSGGSGGVGGAQGGMGGVGIAGAAGVADAGPPRDAGACVPTCGVGRSCCGGKCINPSNDPTNCGTCGMRCQGTTPYCDGTCKPTPCEGGGGSCAGAALCCGTQCCTNGQICCKFEGPISGPPQCYTPTPDQATCPQGCAPLCVSDRNLKRDIEPVDALSVLETVSKLPVSTWSYRADADGVRHMGPMAQDFKSAFGLGDTDRGYYSIDAHGVSLAAIQALYEQSSQQSLRIQGLERENADLQRRFEALERASRR